MKKYLGFLVYFLAFILPFELWEFSTNQVIGSRVFVVLVTYALANGLLFAVLGIILSMISKRLAIVYTHVYFLVAYTIVLGLLVLQVLLHIPFSLMVLNALFDTTVVESSEYFSAQLSAFNLLALLLLLASIVYLWRYFVQVTQSVFAVLLRTKIKMILPIAVFYTVCILQNDLLYSNNMFNELQDAFAQYKQEKALLGKENNYAYLKNVQAVPCYHLATDTVANTIVLVLGESLSRHHMSLYGYGRETNPLLASVQSELVVFDDVIAPAQTTIMSLQKMLSFATIKHPDLLYTQPTMLDVFNRAGYKTYWISNQQVSGIHDTWSKVYAQKASTPIFVNNTNSWLHYSFDEQLLPHFAAALKDTSKFKLIVLHLLGNHMRYDKRYTATFDRFSSAQAFPLICKDAGEQEEQMINTYDNAVLYNDYILYQCIQLLRKSTQQTHLVYVSDHGEAVCEESEYCGHDGAAMSRYMREVPFLYWSNRSMHTKEAMMTWTHRPFQTDQLMNAMLDLGQLRTPMFDSTKSIFSAYFVPSKRYMHDLDYDSLYRKTIIQ
jgi:heptose-I-phosphate ethanolaminephosphotransferase